MSRVPMRPPLNDLGDRLRKGRAKRNEGDGFVRETFRLPRHEAREKAREFLDRYPKAAYWSAVESWRVIADEASDDQIEFTMRRLRTAD